MKRVIVLIAILSVLSFSSQAYANLLTNGDFEDTSTSKFYGWSTDPADGGWNDGNWARRADYPYNGPSGSGSWYAKCWWDGGIAQAVTVVGDQTYQFSIDTYLPSNEHTSATWLGFANVDFYDSNDVMVDQYQLDLSTLSRNTWNATTTSIVSPTPAVKANIVLGMYWDSSMGATVNPPNPTSFDNVDFDVIPEPSSILLLGIGVLGILSTKRKQK